MPGKDLVEGDICTQSVLAFILHRYWLPRAHAIYNSLYLASEFSFSASNQAPLKKNPSLAQPQDISRRPPCCIALGIQSGYTHWSLHPSDGHHPSCRTSGLGLIMYRWPEAKGASAATGNTSYSGSYSLCTLASKMENKSPLTKGLRIQLPAFGHGRIKRIQSRFGTWSCASGHFYSFPWTLHTSENKDGLGEMQPQLELKFQQIYTA